MVVDTPFRQLGDCESLTTAVKNVFSGIHFQKKLLKSEQGERILAVRGCKSPFSIAKPQFRNRLTTTKEKHNMDTFIGMGKNPNPDVPDIPLGLGMELAQNPGALETFGRLSNEKKTELINHIQASVTGEDAKERILKTVSDLSKGIYF